MKYLIRLAALCALLLLPVSTIAGSQQDKMKDCNAQAKGKTGDERKAFMKDCLSAPKKEAAEAAPKKSADPKQRMKDCNAQAKGKKGDERKAFMSQCLKKD
jgi:psiF repeat